MGTKDSLKGFEIGISPRGEPIARRGRAALAGGYSCFV